jgi:hypothetical protein
VLDVVCLFESFILPLSIIATIPLAAIGVGWIHYALPTRWESPDPQAPRPEGPSCPLRDLSGTSAGMDAPSRGS